VDAPKSPGGFLGGLFKGSGSHTGAQKGSDGESAQVGGLDAVLEALFELAGAVDARHAGTEGHSAHVADYATLVAGELGLDTGRTAMLETAAALHDVGMVVVDSTVLLKPGRLTADERREVEAHSAAGARMLLMAGQEAVAEWVLHHHERWDGAGYPSRAGSDDIPLESRILAVCDAYDAMVSERPYRGPVAPDEARHRLQDEAGGAYDPVVVTALLRCLDGGKPEDD
jgi:putative two-component system response regulator